MVMTHVRIPIFTMHYKNTLQERLMIFYVILFKIYPGVGEPIIILIYGGLAKLLQK